MNLNFPARLLVHATNIHSGGGRSLLSALLIAIPADVDSVVQLDSRMLVPENIPNKLTIRYVRASIFQRLKAEYWLSRNSTNSDNVLCFGNVPPFFKSRGHVVVFLQNRYLIDDVKLNHFSLKTRLRIIAERFWFSRKLANASEFVVQTPSMKTLLDACTKGKTPIRVLPFMERNSEYSRKIRGPENGREKKSGFLYVASGEPHKNHRQLIEAWCLLAKEGILPSLKLTIDKLQWPALSKWIGQQIEEYELHVENLGNLSHQHVIRLYGQVGALIFPSTFESCGLPLIEARQAGLPILASELDYVRDVLDPEQTFNPDSAVSIAKAVKRFLGEDEQPLPLRDAAGFLKQILRSVE